MESNKQVDFSGGLTIRRMERAELDLVIEWAAAEGWNPGVKDAECFYAADPEGFFIALLDGMPVGSISAVRYGADFGFIGLFIVRPEYRGRRTGLYLGRAALAHLEGRNIGLDGVLKKVENYKKFGFQYTYKNIRFEARGGGGEVKLSEPLDQFDFSDVVEYDERMFGVRRDKFLHAWLKQKAAVALGIRGAGRLAGYGVIRPCRIGYKIGPLFADEPVMAEDLLNALAAHAAGSVFYLDVPEPNEAAMQLAERRSMKEVFATARMYSKTLPELPIEKIFGVTTFELG